jgi:hypothetical protein
MIGDREFQKQSGLSISNAIGYAKFRSRSHDAVIRVYDDAGNVIATHEHKGEFNERSSGAFHCYESEAGLRRMQFNQALERPRKSIDFCEPSRQCFCNVRKCRMNVISDLKGSQSL